MNRFSATGILFVVLLATSNVFALTAPEGSTALCKDGTYYSGSSKRGACSHHGGIKDWYGAAAATTATTTATSAAAAPAQAPTGPAATMPQQNSSPSPSKMARSASAGGGAGQVWVNTDSKVYHCPGTRWYGTTKHGEYLSESQAVLQGFRADHNKACK